MPSRKKSPAKSTGSFVAASPFWALPLQLSAATKKKTATLASLRF
jgi:hypothetical protein